MNKPPPFRRLMNGMVECCCGMAEYCCARAWQNACRGTAMVECPRPVAQ